MATINTVKETDTFEAQRVQLNSTITKLNTIIADTDSIEFTTVGTIPSDTLSVGQALLYITTAVPPELRIKLSNGNEYKVLLSAVV